MKNKLHPNRGRVLPPNFKFKMDIGFRRAFTWKERIQILVGYSADISMVVATEHHTGRFTPVMEINLTEQTLPKAPLLRKIIKLLSRKSKTALLLIVTAAMLSGCSKEPPKMCVDGKPHRWTQWKDAWISENDFGAMEQSRHCTNCGWYQSELH